ncbi:hypothetical protein BaRGS_00003984, partial [Batillaria attramentaria]
THRLPVRQIIHSPIPHYYYIFPIAGLAWYSVHPPFISVLVKVPGMCLSQGNCGWGYRSTVRAGVQTVTLRRQQSARHHSSDLLGTDGSAGAHGTGQDEATANSTCSKGRDVTLGFFSFVRPGAGP